MKEALYQCALFHERVSPRYAFRHRIYMLLLDLDRLQETKAHIPILSINGPGILAFHDRDHFRFDPSEGSTREKLNRFFLQHGKSAPHRAFLLTHVRIFGYTFNPVSFYFCEDAQGRVTDIVAEVNNTYGEQKAFLLKAGEKHFLQKQFYVSPFIHHDRFFFFNIKEPGRKLRIEITSRTKSGDNILKGRLSGVARPLNLRELAAALFMFPLVTVKVIALIHLHAFILYLRGVPHFGKKESDRAIQETTDV